MIQTSVNDERGGWTSASNAEADTLCEARHTKQKPIPEPPKSLELHPEWTLTGTRIHEALAKRDPSGLTPEHRDIYESCIRIEESKLKEFFGSDEEIAKCKVFIEQRFWVRFVPEGGTTQYAHSGQPDRVYRNGSRVFIVEYKSLNADHPSAPSNLQLRDQVCLVAGEFVIIEQAGCVVVQPMITHNPIICVYNKEQIQRATVDMFQRVVRSNDPNSKPTAGERQCQYCRAKYECLEWQRFSGAMIPGMLSILEVPVSAWTPAQRKVFLDNKGVAQKWLDECEEQLKDIASRDKEAVDGWELKPGYFREQIVDPQKVFERFAAVGGNQTQFLKCVSVTKTRLRNELSALSGAKGKQLDLAMTALTEGAVEVTRTKGYFSRK